MAETAPPINSAPELQKNARKNKLRAVGIPATALFFSLSLTACLDEVDDVRRLSEKYSPEEPDSNVVRHLDCKSQPDLKISPQGDSAFYTETITLPDGRSADFILPTSELSTISKVRIADQIEEYRPDDAISYELFDGDLKFTTYSGEDRVIDYIFVKLDCGNF